MCRSKTGLVPCGETCCRQELTSDVPKVLLGSRLCIQDSSGHGIGPAQDHGEAQAPRGDRSATKMDPTDAQEEGKGRNSEGDGSWTCFKGKKSSHRGSMTLLLTLDAGSWPPHTSVALFILQNTSCLE